MDKTKKYLAFSFVMVLVAVTIVSVIGMILLDRFTATASSRRSAATRRKRFIRMRWPASGLPTSSTEWLWTGPGNKTVRAPARWSTWLAEPWAR